MCMSLLGFPFASHSDASPHDTRGAHLHLYRWMLLPLIFCLLHIGSFRKAGNDDDDSALAAGQVIEAVSTVLQSTKAIPELFPTMEAHLLPMLVQVSRPMLLFVCR